GFFFFFISLARYEGGFFSLQNILLCLGAFIGVFLLAAAIYSLMNREEETTISSGENSSNKTNKKNKKNKK
ncbi:hypothetical protein KC717_01150, partial [Candidatus Dojkabacteria bacterium]|nr:hypothetical protein [Candidatus Dojkabacteria bacterium]